LIVVSEEEKLMLLHRDGVVHGTEEDISRQLLELFNFDGLVDRTELVAVFKGFVAFHPLEVEVLLASATTPIRSVVVRAHVDGRV